MIGLGAMLVLAGGFILFSGLGDDVIVDDTDFEIEPSAGWDVEGDSYSGGPEELGPGEAIFYTYTDTQKSWVIVDKKTGLKKVHGIGKEESPCPDPYPPLVMGIPANFFGPGSEPFSGDLELDGYLLIGAPMGGSVPSWLDTPISVAFPSDGVPNLPAGVDPPLDAGKEIFFSDPIMMAFNCILDRYETQTIESGITITHSIGNPLTGEQSEQQIEIPMTLDVHDSTSPQYENSLIFTDGFESGDTSAWSNLN